MAVVLVANVTSLDNQTALSISGNNTVAGGFPCIVLNPNNGGVQFSTIGDIRNGLTVSPGQIGIYTLGGFGNPGQILVSDGANTRWISVPTPVANIQTFTISSTWTKPTSGSMARIQVWGGGAGGSCGANCGNTGTTVSIGGGGGGYSEITLSLASLTNTVTVIVGAGGVGNTTVGNSTIQFLGASGGATSFGSYITVNGGNNTGCGGNSFPSTSIVYPSFTTSTFQGATVYISNAATSPGMQQYTGGLITATNNTTTNAINISIFGGGGTSLVGNAGSSLWGGGAGGSFNTAAFRGGTGCIVFSQNTSYGLGGNSGSIIGLTASTNGSIPGGGGGAGALTATGVASSNSITGGASGANGQCIVTVW